MQSKTEDFYSEICTTVYESVECELEDTLVDLLPGDGLSTILVVANIKVDGVAAIRLEARYLLSEGSRHGLLTVKESNFHVKLVGESEPLVHYDFIGRAHSEIPTAHLNIHTSNEALLRLMKIAGAKNRAKARARKEARGHRSQPSELHFPVGGRRFRPCLEDIIQFVVLELGVDRRSGCFDTLKQGRMSWRSTQTAAAVSDDPRTALRELHSLGLLDQAAYENALNLEAKLRTDRLAEY